MEKPHETTSGSLWCQLRADSYSMVSRALLLNTPAVELSLGYHATVWWFLLLGMFPDIHLRVNFSFLFVATLCHFYSGWEMFLPFFFFLSFYEHKIQGTIWGLSLPLTTWFITLDPPWEFFLLIFVNYTNNLVIKEIKTIHDLKRENICWFFSSPYVCVCVLIFSLDTLTNIHRILFSGVFSLIRADIIHVR